MQNMVMGGNAPLTTSRFDVVIDWPAAAGTLDASIYLLGASGKTRSDADMIFYNQPRDADESVVITEIGAARTCLSVDLDRVPEAIERIVACVTIDPKGPTLAEFRGLAAQVVVDDRPVLRFAPDLSGATEVAMRVLAFYRRAGTWKIRADGQGFNDGLAPLARSFGVDVADGDQPPSPLPDTEGAGASHSEPVAVPVEDPLDAFESVTIGADPPSPPPQNRYGGATVLTADHAEMRWSHDGQPDFGEIGAKLAWTSRRGGLHGRPRPLELGLGCFYAFRDGRHGIVQSWDGNGQFDTFPFAHLIHAEMTGTDGEERLRINGDHWAEMSGLTLYAYIRSGAPNWATATGSLTLTAPGQQPAVIEIDGGPDGHGIVALAIFRNHNGCIGIDRSMQFAVDHRDLDTRLGWDLDWRTRYI